MNYSVQTARKIAPTSKRQEHHAEEQEPQCGLERGHRQTRKQRTDDETHEDVLVGGANQDDHAEKIKRWQQAASTVKHTSGAV